MNTNLGHRQLIIGVGGGRGGFGLVIIFAGAVLGLLVRVESLSEIAALTRPGEHVSKL